MACLNRPRLIDPSFPPELLLKTIEYLPFDNGAIISALSNTHPLLRSLVHEYERSMTQNYIRRELPHAPSDFPCEPTERGYTWLQECIKKYDVVDETMARLTSDQNCFALYKHNTAVVYTGMLLLYHVASIEPHAAKLDFLKSLPLDPLTAIYLAVHNSTLTARYHSYDSILHQKIYGRFMDANTLSLRSDIEFAFSEGCLHLGPSFIHAMLYAPATAEPTLLNLYHDHVINDWDVSTFDEMQVKPPVTQGPLRNPGEEARSAWTIMLERMSELVKCPLEEVRSRIEEDCDDIGHSLTFLNLAGRRRLMEGKDLEYVD
ncbi:hypothetical protein P280DRAFT_86577 [Massarina eburnea CBS 473.64]|uniref:Uncharacterized protein n=1 Tax=Massarina eburnea CBS 473.64 TaxID=1395130 RepID=A0A6A6RRH9_9PLEO|nr:hypothetical protein P280DRAFT_86577 [Massarina eburnea CBS 473.64]